MSPATEERIGRLRGRVPKAAIPAMVGLRTRLAWRNEAVRRDARAQMSFLLEHTTPGADLDAVARSYVRFQAWRGEARWHPDMETYLPVHGLEHLSAAHATGRGVMMSFMHHAIYEGGFASIGRLGISCKVAVYPYMLRDDAPVWLRQHLDVARSGGAVPVSAGIGTKGLMGLLQSGEVVGIASDVPGHTPVRFVGRDVVGSYGAARLAAATDSPVVVMTSEPGPSGPEIRLHEPMEPRDFDSPNELLQAMLTIHEKAIVGWPEAYDLPLSRWTLTDPVADAAAKVDATAGMADEAQARTETKDRTRTEAQVQS